MTREDRLKFCRKCINRKMNLENGLVCSLTGEQATFENLCPDFKLDESVKERPINYGENLERWEMNEKLSRENLEKLRLDQNLPLGILTAGIIGLIGSVLWGTITVATGFQIGIMALAIGAGVGFGMRLMGKGIDYIFGIWGAGIALLACLLGNFLSIIGFAANDLGIGYLNALLGFNYNYFTTVMGETFSLIDLAFYGIAMYEGYRFSFRGITEREVEDMEKE